MVNFSCSIRFLWMLDFSTCKIFLPLLLSCYYLLCLDSPFGNVLNWGDADLWELQETKRLNKLDVETSDFCSPAPAKSYLMFPERRSLGSGAELCTKVGKYLNKFRSFLKRRYLLFHKTYKCVIIYSI